MKTRKKKQITETDYAIIEDYTSLMELDDIAKKHNISKDILSKKLSYMIYRGLIPKAKYQELRAQKRRKKIATYAIKTSAKDAVDKFGVSISTVLKSLREASPELASFGEEKRAEKNHRDTKQAFGDRIIQIIKDGGKLSDIKALNNGITYNTMRLIIQPVFGKDAYNALLRYDEKKKRQKQMEGEIQTRKYAQIQLRKAKLSQEKPSIWGKLNHTVLRLAKNKEGLDIDNAFNRVEELTQTIEAEVKETGQVLEKEWDELQDLLIEHIQEDAQDKIRSYEVTKEKGLRVKYKYSNIYGKAFQSCHILEFYNIYKKP